MLVPMERSKQHGLVGSVPTVLAVVLTLALGGCDKSDNDWEQPTDPDPVGQPALTLTASVAMDGDGEPNVGDEVTYALHLVNNGLGAAHTVAVDVTLAEGVILDLARAYEGSFDGSKSRWLLTDLLPAGVADLELEVTVGAGTVGQELSLVAEVVHVDPADTTPANHDAVAAFTVVNTPPQAGDDVYALDEGAFIGLAAPGLLANDSDPEDEPFTLQTEPVQAPEHGVLVMQDSGAFSYAHDGGEAVVDSFRYVIVDASAETDTATVRLDIAPVNDVPIMVDLGPVQVREGQTFSPIILDALVSDDDHADNELQWLVLGADALGVSISSDRVLRVTIPGTDWHGEDLLTLRVADPAGAFTGADVLFVVESVNDLPVVAPLPGQIIQSGGQFVSIPLDNFVTDADHADDQLSWSVSGEQPMLVVIDDQRVLTVSPPDGIWLGSVIMTVRATDPEGGWGEGTARFEVVPAR